MYRWNVFDTFDHPNTTWLFANNPIPMWIYDPSTLRFLDVNDAAQRAYGYSREEFLAMTIGDIHPAVDFLKLQDNLKREPVPFEQVGEWRHQHGGDADKSQAGKQGEETKGAQQMASDALAKSGWSGEMVRSMFVHTRPVVSQQRSRQIRHANSVAAAVREESLSFAERVSSKHWKSMRMTGPETCQMVQKEVARPCTEVQQN